MSNNGCNKDPYYQPSRGIENLPTIYFQIQNDLGYDFQLKSLGELRATITAFTTSPMISVPPGTIVQLINRQTQTLRQIVVGGGDPTILISQLQICTTKQVCGTVSNTTSTQLPSEFGLESFTVEITRDGSSYGWSSFEKFIGNQWKDVDMYGYLPFNIQDTYRFTTYTPPRYVGGIWIPREIITQRQFHFPEPGKYRSSDIVQSPDTCGSLTGPIPITPFTTTPPISHAKENQQSTLPHTDTTTTANIAILLYVVLLLGLAIIKAKKFFMTRQKLLRDKAKEGMKEYGILDTQEY